MTATDEAIEAARRSFFDEKERLARTLSRTPDDRLKWSPSPNSRTPLALVVHAAYAIGSVHRMLVGNPFSIPTTAEADRSFREFERDFTTREQALDLLEENGTAYVEWLNALSSSRLDDMVTLPFGLGAAPLSAALSFVPDHTRWHCAQLEYVQTAYGDHDWHLGR